MKKEKEIDYIEEIIGLHYEIRRTQLICEKISEKTNSFLSKEELLEIDIKSAKIIKKKFPKILFHLDPHDNLY